MNRILLKLSLVCATGAILITANPKTVKAYEESVAGYPYDKNISDISGSADGITAMNLSASNFPIPGYTDLCIANVDTNLIIRKGPGENYDKIGKLPKNAGCNKLEDSKDGWTKISADTASGETLVGYVMDKFLITGSAATELAREVGSFVVKANDEVNSNLNIRAEASTNSDIIDTIGSGEELLIIDNNVSSNDKDYPNWVKVSLDSDSEEGSYGYVAKDYVEPSFDLAHALSMKELLYGGPGVSQKRIDMVEYAKDYLGGRYVYGGTSLTNGIDCSAFMQKIYKNVADKSIPRTSREQANDGHEISANELKPGDLVFYGSKSYISHVAMYIGNGRVIHASNRRDGIKISNMYYRTPVKCVRIIND